MKIQIVSISEVPKLWKEQYEAHRRMSQERKIELLRKRASELGFDIVPKEKT